MRTTEGRFAPISRAGSKSFAYGIERNPAYGQTLTPYRRFS
jgi:hypothetical protein